MAVELSDAVQTNITNTLRNIADSIGLPAAPPAPTSPSGGGSAPAPSGFTGRTLGDPAVWKQQASFEENFPTLAPRGSFLDIYKMWSAYSKTAKSTDKKGIYDPFNIAVVDVDGVRAMELRIVAAQNNGGTVPSGANPQPRLYGPQKDGYTTGERIEIRCKILKPGPGGHWVPLGWVRDKADWPGNGEPDMIETDTDGSPKVGGWFHVQNGGSHGEGQVKLVSDVSLLDWVVVTAERIPGKSYRWYVNGKLCKQVLAPGLTPTEAEKAVTTVLKAPYNIPLHELRQQLQLEPKGTGQKDDIIVLVDHWSLWERA